MKTKSILLFIAGATVLVLSACQTEPRYVTTPVSENALAPIAAGPGTTNATETRTVRAW